MSHGGGRSSTDKEKFLSKQLKSADKNCCSVSRYTADYKCLRHRSKADDQQRVKRLRSRKERSQMKRGGKDVPKFKSHHNHCQQHSRKDITYFHDSCCHRSCPCSSRRVAAFPNVVPAAQETSFITESRLIGHHGLFNHEVKSVDIERLLSKQSKLEKIRQKARRNIESSCPTPTFQAPSPISITEKLEADINECKPREKNVDSVLKVHDDGDETGQKISEGSDVTPGQKSNSVICEKSRESQLKPDDVRQNVTKLSQETKGHMISPLEKTPKNQGSPAHQTQSFDFRPSPPPPSSSNAADSLDSQLQPDTNRVTESVCGVAARLSECLLFPRLRRRNLVAESREVLLKALRERHGPQLQENLSGLQRCLSSHSDPTNDIQDQEPTMIEEDEPQCTDSFPTEFEAVPPLFETPETKSVKKKGSVHNYWKSSPLLLRNLNQAAECLKRPEETSASILDDILRPHFSSQYRIDSEPSGLRDHLFALSPTSCFGEKNSATPQWAGSFNRPIENKETFTFNPFEQSLINRTITLGSPQYSNSSSQPLFPYHAQPPGHSRVLMHFPEEQDPFETKRCSVALSLSPQIVFPEQSQSFQPFSQFSNPPLRSHHTDMIHYPPSHMLESDPTRSRSSLLSPEHWSFPPMRLY